VDHGDRPHGVFVANRTYRWEVRVRFPLRALSAGGFFFGRARNLICWTKFWQELNFDETREQVEIISTRKSHKALRNPFISAQIEVRSLCGL